MRTVQLSRGDASCSPARHGRVRRVLLGGAGVGALLGAGMFGTAHADIPITVTGCGITAAVISVTDPGCSATPGTAPAPTAGPVSVTAQLPAATPGVAQVVPATGDGPIVTIPPVVAPVVTPVPAPVNAALPIPVATVVVDTPVARCTVDAAAVTAGAGCDAGVQAATGVLPPVAGAVADAEIDNAGDVVDPVLADANTVTGGSVVVGPQTGAAASTCTGVGVLDRRRSPARPRRRRPGVRARRPRPARRPHRRRRRPRRRPTLAAVRPRPPPATPLRTAPSPAMSVRISMPGAAGATGVDSDAGAAGGNGSSAGTDGANANVAGAAGLDGGATLVGPKSPAKVPAADGSDSSLPSTGVAIGGGLGLAALLTAAGFGIRLLVSRRRVATAA